MSKTVWCVLLKVLMLARADNLSKYSDSDFIQNNDLQNFKSDRRHSDSVSMRNKVDEISFPNMSAISESIESILSKPKSPRAFVEFHNEFLNEEDDISVTFRWNQPEFSEGIIQGYTVQCWFIENQKEIQICDKSVSATLLEYTVNNVKPNTTYYFQVRAHTKVGAGPYTDSIDVSTTHENPIPQLLMVTEKGIDIWDLDSKMIVNLVKVKNIQSATYSIAEDKIYWSNKEKELMLFERNKSNITKITKLLNIAHLLCIDWIARNLYWLEFDLNIYSGSSMMRLDLTMWEKGIGKYEKISELMPFYYFGGLNVLPSIGYVNFHSIKINRKIIMRIKDLAGFNDFDICYQGRTLEF
ncbi:hypothetical protein ACFW04_001285 [Cataglyphis niger]